MAFTVRNGSTIISDLGSRRGPQGVSGAASHASNHTDGTDDIQDATSSVKGLATPTQITKLDGIEALATANDSTTVQTLTDAATVTYDVASGHNAKLTLTQSITLSAPTNATEGESGVLVITQAAGGWAVTLAAGWTSVVGDADITALGAGDVVQYSWIATAAGFNLFIEQAFA